MMANSKFLNLRREININKSTNILTIIGEPNVKKTFFSILMAPISPTIYLDFSGKSLIDKKEVLARYNMDIYQVPLDKVNEDSVLKIIKEVERGTIVLDSFSFLSPISQAEIANEILNKPRNVKFNLVVHIFSAPSKRGYRHSICLPSILLPLDKRLIDVLFVSDYKLRMLGRTEVAWRIKNASL